MHEKIKHLLYCPFTGLGLHKGWRGDRWFNNRLKIFKQFVIPSLLNQTNKNFTLWISFTPELKRDIRVAYLREYLNEKGIDNLFTYTGVAFYDDKYPDQEARERLFNSLNDCKLTLASKTKDTDYVLMTIQPSDDLFDGYAVSEIQREIQDVDAVGFGKGYIINYLNKEVSEYNPTTNPPFYTIKFKREDFIDPRRHLEYTSLKKDIGKYKKGTPLPSHEYVKDCLNYKQLHWRGFMVGCHTENISTYYNHPFKGENVTPETLKIFGIYDTPVLKLKWSWRKWVLRKLPHKVQRKLRYLFGEKLYEFFRS